MPESSQWRPLKMLAFVAAGFIIAITFAVGVTAATTPGCVSCHAELDDLVAATAETAHIDVSCETCHVPSGVASRIAFGSHQLFGMTLRFGTGPDRARAAVPDVTCLECHAQVMQETTNSRGYIINHASCTRGSTCTDCHSATAHGASTTWIRSSEMGACLECHSAQEAYTDCDMCHDARTKGERLQSGAWAVTHGSEWRRTHGMGDMRTCAACHNEEYCVDCHGIRLPHPERYVTRTHSNEALVAQESCTTCHDTAFCTSCHGLAMPHPAEFTEQHARISEELDKQTCLRCHAESDCVNCHVKHVHPGNAAEAAAGGGE